MLLAQLGSPGSSQRLRTVILGHGGSSSSSGKGAQPRAR